jgi:hypothetical protein
MSLVTKKAPDFTIDAVVGDGDFKKISLADYKGKYVVLFFYPTGSPFWASNYRIVQATTNLAERVYASLAQLRAEGPVVVLWKNALITPGEMKYYFPEIPVVDLSGRIRKQAIAVPTGNVVWLDPVPAAEQHAFDALDPIRQAGPFHVARLEEGRRFTAGGQDLAVTSGR